MTIIVFLVDTSASMNQRTYLGTALIDVAKAAVESFMKSRSRDASSRWDRYMLLTFEDPPANVKAGWKESHLTFASELKNLKASGLTSMGPSLKHAFDLLNLNRMTSGIETYGQGRSPFYNESTLIIVITDGGHLTTTSGIQPELNLPMNSVVPGAELTKEPFRWDQRIFSLVLRLPASVPPDVSGFPYIPTAENAAIDVMCEVTGGRSYAVYSQKMMNAAIESLVQKVQCGVVIHFEKFGPDPPPVSDPNRVDIGQDVNGSSKENMDTNKTIVLDEEDKKHVNHFGTNGQHQTNHAWHSCRKLIYVPRSAQKGHCTGHWPIPEGYWPDLTSPSLPPRTAHPVVQFSCQPSEPLVIENLPFDKYELEPSPLTQYILERRQPNISWQVFVANSSKFSEMCHPFGYLKASSSLTTVNLFVMPYNYPVLLPLLDELFKVHNMKPNQQWRQRFENYLKTMPGYYAPNLRRALARMGAPNLVSDNMDNCLSYSVITYLKKLKNQARMEMDRLNASIGQKPSRHEGIRVASRSRTKSVLQRKDFNQLLASLGGNMAILKQELQQDYSGFTLAVEDPEIKPQFYRNPYDIPRKSLIDQISRMRNNFLRTSINSESLIDLDEKHRVPISQMGNYQEVLKKQPPPLRELENTPTRLHMFGNPFKVNKQLTVDEAEEAIVIGSSPRKRTSSESLPNSPTRKRKPGPLPKDIPYRRLSTSSITPPSSPAPSFISDTDSETDETPLQIVTDSDSESTALGSDGEETPAYNHITSSPNLDSSSHSENGVCESDALMDGVKGTDSRLFETLAEAFVGSKKDLQVWNFNRQLKGLVTKEVKRPGRNFDRLFQLLDTVRGSPKVQVEFVREIIEEAHRFKRRYLIELLEKFVQTLSNQNNNKLNKYPSKTHIS
ncbi:unnamed protein product [Candidula unifasciata]|uniref:VWFA domain-containing protein n=1 Tax=Candidula unifasciata TaxID=100452 RepID=A0A8S3ZJ36_9EUPU|nr:unnamed protein product [Candidula unifasciata]